MRISLMAFGWFAVAAALASCGPGGGPPPPPVTTSAPPSAPPPATPATPASPAAPVVSASSAPPAHSAGPGLLRGRITFTGPNPGARNLAIGAPQAGCPAAIADESLLVGAGGGLKNAVVLVAGAPGTGAPDPAAVALFDQKGCAFNPRVLVVAKGAKVGLRNSDTVAHNTNISAVKNSGFNGTIPAGETQSVVFAEAERMEVVCNIHPWMKGWIVVHDGPAFAVTAADGSFTIPNLPAGTYEVRLWHEAAKSAKQSVTIPPGGEAVLESALSPK